MHLGANGLYLEQEGDYSPRDAENSGQELAMAMFLDVGVACTGNLDEGRVY
jgi:hypothetical protein